MVWSAGGAAVLAVGYPVNSYSGQQIYRSTEQWRVVDRGPEGSGPRSSPPVTAHALRRRLGAEGVSTDAGATWTVHYSDNSFSSLTLSADGSTLFGTANSFGGQSFISQSTDAGQNWVSIQTGTIDFNGLVASADGNRVTGAASGGPFFTASAVHCRCQRFGVRYAERIGHAAVFRSKASSRWSGTPVN